MLGDQQAALVGQTCYSVGEAKNTYGTGAFTLLNTGTTPATSDNGLLSTILWQIGEGGETVYALEGAVFVAGAAVQWLRDGLGVIATSSEVEALAAQADRDAGVVVGPSTRPARARMSTSGTAAMSRCMVSLSAPCRSAAAG